MATFLNPTFLIAILVALSFHEFAHGFVAKKLGDPTAEYQGRLTLNPLAHLDPIGSILFLLVGFGWGKPVPIDPRYFHRPKRDTALVSLAGPASNFLLAAISFAVLMFLMPHTIVSVDRLLIFSKQGSILLVFLRSLFSSLVFINLGLMSFNLLPIAPLDGSKILQAFIPLRYEDAYDMFMLRGPYILLGIFLVEAFFGIPLLSAWIESIMNGVLTLFTATLGWL